MKAARLLAVLFVLASGALEAADGPRLSERLANGPRGRYAVWVYFKDRGPAADALAAAQATVTPRALARRAARGSVGVSVADAPPSASYVAAVSAAATKIRQESRWMNAVSVEATAAQVAAIEALPFVARVDVVRGFRKRREEMDTRVAAMAADPLRKASTLDYGSAFGQVNQIKVPFLHDLGLEPSSRLGREDVRPPTYEPAPFGRRPQWTFTGRRHLQYIPFSDHRTVIEPRFERA